VSPREPPKLRSEPLGDVAWITAQQELHVATVLCEGSQWASSVFHSHQAAEQTIKAVLLRTSGVSGDEFSGSAGHDLVGLMGRHQGNLHTPVSNAVLQRLSCAYLDTRYPAFPPQQAPTLPSAAFSVSDAREALDVASSLLEWGRGPSQVDVALPVPPQRQMAARDEDDVADNATPLTLRTAVNGWSPADAQEAARRVAAEGKAQELEHENQRLREKLDALRQEADQAVEGAQKNADLDKERALCGLKDEHERQVVALQAKADKLQRALNAALASD